MKELIQIKKLSDLITVLENMVGEIKKNQPELLTVKEVMKELKISRNSFNRLKDDGILKVYSLRGKLYCKRNEIMQTIENCRVN